MDPLTGSSVIHTKRRITMLLADTYWVLEVTLRLRLYDEVHRGRRSGTGFDIGRRIQVVDSAGT